MIVNIYSVHSIGFYVYVPEDILCRFIRAHANTVACLDGGREILDYLEQGCSEEAIKERFQYYRSANDYCGIYGVISDVMSAETKICFEYYVSDGSGDSDDAILYMDGYPDKKQIDVVTKIMQKYIAELGGKMQVEEIDLKCIQ